MEKSPIRTKTVGIIICNGSILLSSEMSKPVIEQFTFNITPLGAGREVGRSCIIVSCCEKRVMVFSLTHQLINLFFRLFR